MHSWTFRLNAIFTFTVTVLAVLSALNALSVPPRPRAPAHVRTHPGGNPGANFKSISHRCHLFEDACVWELTKETIDLPLGCLQGGSARCVRRGTVVGTHCADRCARRSPSWTRSRSQRSTMSSSTACLDPGASPNPPRQRVHVSRSLRLKDLLGPVSKEARHPHPSPTALVRLCACGKVAQDGQAGLQGYLAHKKHPPRRTLQ